MTGDQYPPWPDLFRWLTVLKDRVETLPAIGAEQVVTGTLTVDSIPDLPWSRILKAGSSLGDLETRRASDLSSGTLPAGRMPALTGDVTSVAGDVVTTLATVNSSPGSFGSGTSIPILTVNGKGLVTSVSAQPIQTGALTRVNDTNITATLGGTPATALLQDVSITLGWTGTLAAARLNANVVQSVVNDTNITGSIAAQALTLGWTGTLGVTRGGTGTGTAFTAGSVVFAGASGIYSQDNANLFWDDTNNRLGIGTVSPSAKLHIVGTASDMLRVFNSSGSETNIWIAGDDSASHQSTLYFGSNKANAIFRPTSGNALQFYVDNAVAATIDAPGRLGIGTTPTAFLHLKAGTATANTAPLKLTSGTVLATAEAGAIEFTTDTYFSTITTGAARKGIVLDDGARLTSGVIPVATTNGRLIDGPTWGARQTYTETNVTTDRAYDANATTLDEIADVIGTLIADLRAKNMVA